jgi:hypothetical protein
LPSQLTPEISGISNPNNVEDEGQVNDFLQSISPAEPLCEIRGDGPPHEDAGVVERPRKQYTPPNLESAMERGASGSGSPLPSLLRQHSEGYRRNGKRPVASDFVDTFDGETTTEASIHAGALSSDFLGDDAKSGLSTPLSTSLPQPIRPREPTFNKVSVIRRCVIDFSEDEEEDDSSDTDRIMTDIALVKAKEEEIRKLKQRIERYKGKQRSEVGHLGTTFCKFHN